MAVILAFLAGELAYGVNGISPPHPDEVWTLRVLDMPLDAISSYIFAQDNHPPLYYLVAKVWSLVIGKGIDSIRLLSCLFGGLALAAILAFACLYRRISLLVPLLLLASNPLFVHYSSTVRPYSMVVFLTALATLSGLHLRHSILAERTSIFLPLARNPGRLVLILTFYSSCLLLALTHYYGTLYALILLAWDFVETHICRRRVPPMLVALAALIWPFCHFLIGSSASQIESNSWVRVFPFVSTLNNVLMALFPVQLISVKPHFVFNLSLILVIALILRPVHARWSLPAFADLTTIMASKEAYLALPIVVLYLFSAVVDLVHPFSTPYYFLVALPSSVVLMGIILAFIRRTFSSIPAFVLLSGVVCSQLLLAHQRLLLP
jgi:uncharacterized membrane protein